MPQQIGCQHCGYARRKDTRAPQRRPMERERGGARDSFGSQKRVDRDTRRWSTQNLGGKDLVVYHLVPVRPNPGAISGDANTFLPLQLGRYSPGNQLFVESVCARGAGLMDVEMDAKVFSARLSTSLSGVGAEASRQHPFFVDMIAYP